MARTRPVFPALLGTLAVLLFVQLAIAGPVCRCAPAGEAMPCHVPETPRGCCAGGSEPAGNAPGLDCCKMAPFADDTIDDATVPVHSHDQIEAPARSTVFHADTVRTPARNRAGTSPGFAPPEPLWLRNSTLLR